MKRMEYIIIMLLALILTGCTAELDIPTYSDIILTASSSSVEEGSTLVVNASAADQRGLHDIAWSVDNGIILEEKDNASITVTSTATGNMKVTASEEKTGKTASITITVTSKPEIPEEHPEADIEKPQVPDVETPESNETPEEKPQPDVEPEKPQVPDVDIPESNENPDVDTEKPQVPDIETPDSHETPEVEPEQPETDTDTPQVPDIEIPEAPETPEEKPEIPDVPAIPDIPERKDGKDVINSRLLKLNQWGQTEHISQSYDYPRKDTYFSEKGPSIILGEGEDVEIHMESEDGTWVEDVEWFVEYTGADNPSSLYLFTPEETLSPNAQYAWELSPVILRENGDGSVAIEGTDRFNDSPYPPTGNIIAVVDNSYVHRKPFYIMTEKDRTELGRHNEIEAVVKELSEPLMKYNDLEKTFLLNRTVTRHLRYVKDMRGDYNTFVNGIAVCQGYAEMLSRLGKEIGLDALYLAGDSESGLHAWNAVRLDDGYYYIDPTWNDNHETLMYFMMDPSDFTGYIGGYHEPLIRKENLGVKYINGNYDYYAMEESFRNAVLSPMNDIASPNPEDVTFIGNSSNSGYLTTYEEGIEYNKGDGNWIELEPGKSALLENIYNPDRSCFAPDENNALIGSPQFILLRRVEDGRWSNYVKKDIYSRNAYPDWLEVENGKVLHANVNMEYSNGSGSYRPVPSNEPLELAPGVYSFRMQGKSDHFTSDPFEVTVD